MIMLKLITIPRTAACPDPPTSKEPFDIIKCEIFKRAEILKKLGKEQKGGAQPSDEDKTS